MDYYGVNGHTDQWAERAKNRFKSMCKGNSYDCKHLVKISGMTIFVHACRSDNSHVLHVLAD